MFKLSLDCHVSWDTLYYHINRYNPNHQAVPQILGTFPKDFFQVATSQGYFPKWQLPKYANSEVATSQVCPSRSARPQA